MATVANTWAGNLDDGDPADGGVVETALDALRAGINSIDASQIASGSNIDGDSLLDNSVPSAKLEDDTVADGKLDWSSVTALRAAAAGRKVTVGTKTITLAAAASGTATITFASDGNDSPTAFSSATGVIVQLTAQHAHTAGIVAEMTGAPTATTVAIRVFTVDASTPSLDVTVHWTAIGPA